MKTVVQTTTPKTEIGLADLPPKGWFGFQKGDSRKGILTINLFSGKVVSSCFDYTGISHWYYDGNNLKSAIESLWKTGFDVFVFEDEKELLHWLLKD